MRLWVRLIAFGALLFGSLAVVAVVVLVYFRAADQRQSLQQTLDYLKTQQAEESDRLAQLQKLRKPGSSRKADTWLGLTAAATKAKLKSDYPALNASAPIQRYQYSEIELTGAEGPAAALEKLSPLLASAPMLNVERIGLITGPPAGWSFVLAVEDPLAAQSRDLEYVPVPGAFSGSRARALRVEVESVNRELQVLDFKLRSFPYDELPPGQYRALLAHDSLRSQTAALQEAHRWAGQLFTGPDPILQDANIDFSSQRLTGHAGPGARDRLLALQGPFVFIAVSGTASTITATFTRAHGP